MSVILGWRRSALDPGRKNCARTGFRGKNARFCVASALASAALLVAQTSFAFRSAGNLADFDGQKRVAFASPTISLELFSELAPNVSLAGVEANVKQAAATWRAPGCTDVAISYIGTTQSAATPGDGHNTIQWVSNWNERGFPKTSPGLSQMFNTRRTRTGTGQSPKLIPIWIWIYGLDNERPAR